MRLLFACQPVRSHFHSLVPIALEAQALGHTVGVASGPWLEPLVRRLGFDFLPCGLDFDPADSPLLRLPGQEHLADAPMVVRQLVGFAAGLGPPFARDLLARGPAWRPDVIVREPVEFGSAIVAERWHIPYASVMWAIYINPRFLMREAFAGVCGDFGLDAEAVIDGFDRYLVIRYLPPSWQIALSPDPAATIAFRTAPFDRSMEDASPAWLATPPSRRTVCVTLGLSFSQAPHVFRTIIDAFDGLDAHGIVTVGTDLDPALVGPLPANVVVERYVPFSLLLPNCDAMVFHGGFNSLHAALWHGLPSVVIPQEGGDQEPTAQAVAELGLGLHVPGPVPPADAIRSAIVRILREPSFTATARSLQAQMLALPPLAAAVMRLEALDSKQVGEPEVVTEQP
jgi:UDP:flavonoid glycosyltransferase YjiC (YdhE family)